MTFYLFFQVRLRCKYEGWRWFRPQFFPWCSQLRILSVFDFWLNIWAKEEVSYSIRPSLLPLAQTLTHFQLDTLTALLPFTVWGLAQFIAESNLLSSTSALLLFQSSSKPLIRLSVMLTLPILVVFLYLFFLFLFVRCFCSFWFWSLI